MPDIAYVNDAGEAGTLTGKAPSPRSSTPLASWVDRRHPLHAAWTKLERRQRASYIATRELLARFLVPHRFEGDAAPATLRRAGLGYGIGINAAWISEIMGHIRGAPATYTWGPFAPELEAGTLQAPPVDSAARSVWDDADLDNTTWTNFFERTVLEWILSSPGGFVLVDGHEELDRPILSFVPWSWVEDVGRGEYGFDWIRLGETVDNRAPRDKEADALEHRHVLFELLEDGSTVVGRYNGKGKPIDEPIDLGSYVDRQGQPILPLVPAAFGTHPAISFIGAGLLMGLDDIVLDTFNLVSEIREGYRSVTFDILVHVGPDSDVVKDALDAGSRLVGLGDYESASLDRLGANATEVSAGLELLEANLKAWGLSARRKVREAMERAAPQSGVSMKAEFQLDIRPLLVEVAEFLDSIESDVMHLAGQVAGFDVSKLAEVGVSRGTDFQLEDEASRIARMVSDFGPAWNIVPAEAKTELVMDWLEATGVDLDKEIQVADGTTTTFREFLPTRVEDLAELEERAARTAAQTPTFGGLGI